MEAAGTNQTAEMQNSLTGQSPTKQWNFATTDTVRCVNCHADSTEYNHDNPPPAGSDLAPHATAYRGILMQNFQDRDLKPAGEGYNSDNFALCFMCHSEQPFRSASLEEIGNTTGFWRHKLHATGILYDGSGGLNIDQAGDGQGNAICSECHYRVHSTGLSYNIQDRSNSRLVNFAPDVQGYNGAGPSWTSTGVASGSCTLKCHGATHDPTDLNADYNSTYVPKRAFVLAITPPSPATFSASGDLISYRYLVTNASAAVVAGPITISDDRATVTCPSGDLAANATMTCTGSFVITDADVTAGSATNNATATNGTISSSTMSSTVRLLP